MPIGYEGCSVGRQTERKQPLQKDRDKSISRRVVPSVSKLSTKKLSVGTFCTTSGSEVKQKHPPLPIDKQAISSIDFFKFLVETA
jgi:hypothetical protein